MPKLNHKTDCFAYGMGKYGKPDCAALSELKCDTCGKPCSFYANKDSVNADTKRKVKMFFKGF